MTLDQFQELKTWHQRHGRDAPMEAVVWNSVLTLWLMGWVGGPAALMIGMPALTLGALPLLFLPNAYVNWRSLLHRRGRLRCDWVIALR